MKLFSTAMPSGTVATMTSTQARTITQPLMPEVGRRVIDDIRTELGLAKGVKPEELRVGDCPTRIIEIWQDAIEGVENRPFPRLQNTDG
jgi:hypothetical protein